MNLYIHSPIRLHGVVLNYLSAGTTLPVTGMPFTTSKPTYLARNSLSSWSVVNNLVYSFFSFLVWMRLSAFGTSATSGLLYQPQMLHDDEYAEVGGMKIGRGNRSTRKKT
jgi:hypothetical protein